MHDKEVPVVDTCGVKMGQRGPICHHKYNPLLKIILDPPLTMSDTSPDATFQRELGGRPDKLIFMEVTIFVKQTIFVSDRLGG